MQRCCYKCFIESEHLYCLENYYIFFIPMDRLTPMRCGIGAIPPLGAEWPVCHKATVVDMLATEAFCGQSVYNAHLHLNP